MYLQFSYNDKIQSSTGFSPFYLNYRQHPQKSVGPRHEVKTEVVGIFKKQMKKLSEEAAAAMEKAVRDMKKYYDKCRQDALEYEIRDQVYLKGSHILLCSDYRRPMTELLSLMAVMLEGLGFNLCVAPFLNVCVLNLLQRVGDGVCWRWLEFSQRCHTRVGWRETKSDHSEDEG